MRVSRNLHPLFGAELTGITLTGAVAGEERQALLDAVGKYGVILLRDQPTTQTQLGEFAVSLGPLWSIKSTMLQETTTVTTSTAAVYDFRNRDKAGNLLSDNDPQMIMKRNNEAWHT